MHGKYLSLWSMMRNERRPLRGLLDDRDAKLRRLVAYASRHVPFYRDLYRRHGIQADDISTAQDLAKLPTIDKKDLRARPRSDLIGDRYGSAVELSTLRTSGSSGMPLELFIDREYEALRKAQSLRPYVTNGRRLMDHVVYFTSHPDQNAKWYERLGLMRETRIDASEDHAIQLKTYTLARPQVVQGYPSALISFAAYINRERARIPQPRHVFTDSELLTSASRRLIENVFGAPVIDVFGTWETGNIAYECGRRTGYHIADDCVIVELLTDDGIEARNGEEGELVCTVLDNLAMPLIRYNLHDVAKRATYACNCGRSFPLLDIIGGRSDDVVRLANGSTISSQSFLNIFSFLAGVVREFQITQQAVDRFIVAVVPDIGFEDAHAERIRSLISSHCPGASVQVRLAERIDREASGKLRAFRSLVSA